jgi:hypothetical protein
MSLDSFMNKTYSIVNLLSLALGNETAAKRQIILSSDNEKFTIPVTPRSYEIKIAQNNETIDILDFGEAMLFGNAKLKRLSFSGFFPHPKHDYPFIVGDVKTPIECVELLTKWKEAKKPIRVIITDSPVNLMMGLREFTYREQDGTRDIYYKLSFIEYKELNTPSANNDKQIDETTGLKQRTDEPENPESWVDKADDILDASKKVYGDYSHWRNIVQSNDLKNLAINNVTKLNLRKNLK